MLLVKIIMNNLKNMRTYLAGAMDRVVDGGVVDFISVGWWPAFNVADSAISIGMFLLVVTVLFGERLGMYTRDEGSS